MSVCVIPARGGSKRIPKKNIRPFCGRPMIAWSIAAARDAGCFSQVVVSTDDSEISALAQDLGAAVPFLRDSSLADDHTPTVPVIADAIARLDLPEDTDVCCLYATAPFADPVDIRQSGMLLKNENATFVVSVVRYGFPIQRALRRSEDGAIAMFMPEHLMTRSQDLEDAWHDAGQFYWGRASTWKNPEVPVFGEGAQGWPLPAHRVQDIDTLEDWRRAEVMMRVLQETGAAS